jgi:VanZ family protein
MLQNYLQDAVGMFSGWSYHVGGIKIPFVLTFFLLFLVFIIFRFRKDINPKNVIVWLIIFLLWVLGRNSTDFYSNLPFYQLQNNWHYFAYGIFAFLAYQFFSVKTSNPAKVIYSIYFMALFISTFDEAMQIILSNRVFDISDIAKDVWGVLMGILFVVFIYKDYEFYKGWKLRENKIKDYLNNPLAIILFLFVFSYTLLLVSSLLTEAKYGFNIVFIALSIFFIFFFIFHKTRKKSGKIAFTAIFGVLIVLQGISIALNFNRNITFNITGLTVYKGIPLPYFDIMIYENGIFRPVDKKTTFNQIDKKFFFEKASNILVIGCGKDRKLRMGFPEDLESQFIFNEKSGKALQVIMLPTSDACKVYNRLKKEKKKVVFLIHNTK